MNWAETIEQNRVALARIVSLLFAMIGWSDHRTPIAETLPRALYFAVLRLLRPAESAVRRLIVAAARGIVVTWRTPGKQRAGGGAQSLSLARLKPRVRIANSSCQWHGKMPAKVGMPWSSNDPAGVTQPDEPKAKPAGRAGSSLLAANHIAPVERNTVGASVNQPYPLRLSCRSPSSGLPKARTGEQVSVQRPVRKGEVHRDTRVPAFPLLDPLTDFRLRPAGQSANHSIPRIRTLGLTPVMVADLYWKPKKSLRRFTPLERFDPTGAASHIDAFGAVTLCRRLLSLKAALDDLPKQAIRLARWQARFARFRELHPNRPRRGTPFRPGFPPGYRPKLRPARNQHDEEREALNAILLNCNDLAHRAWYDSS
jgi:hypothetical protein